VVFEAVTLFADRRWNKSSLKAVFFVIVDKWFRAMIEPNEKSDGQTQ